MVEWGGKFRDHAFRRRWANLNRKWMWAADVDVDVNVDVDRGSGHGAQSTPQHPFLRYARAVGCGLGAWGLMRRWWCWWWLYLPTYLMYLN